MESELENFITTGKISKDVAEKLAELEPGTVCEHRSWGVGTVVSWDFLGGQILLDFTDRPGHGMGLEFAAKSLAPIAQDHVLAQRVLHPEKLAALAADDPVELIRLALRSYGGSMTIDTLESVLMGTVVQEDKFKSWWDSTKRKLRQDKSFVVPPRRTLPLELRDESVSPAEALLSDFDTARDLKDKIAAVSAIVTDLDTFDNPQEALQPVIENVNSAVEKATKLHPIRAVELIIARDDILTLVPGLRDAADSAIEAPSIAAVLRTEKGHVGHMLSALPVVRARLLLAAFPAAYGDEWSVEALGLLNKVGSRAIQEITKYLIAGGRSDDLVADLKRGVRHRDLSPDVLLWVCKERKGVGAELVDDELVVAIMNCLEKQHMDEDSRRGGRLHDYVFDDRDLIGDLVREMQINQVRAFARRLLMTPVFEELNRRSLLARVIKVHAGIQELVTGDDEVRDEGLIVSWESLEKRKNDLQELVQKKIPENVKEISIARSYGDLRENFEYKAAKEMQTVLMRRKGEWEMDLQRARGTDFEDANPATVSVGTVVRLEPEDGSEVVTFTLLGAWDSDPF
ncbi:MAG: hypothetical protein ACC661_07145, partial [Verrucomicrobiales bacterium]